MKHPISPYRQQINHGVDRNDPKAEITAIELRFPPTFCERAWKVIHYFEGTMFLFAYKGKFVVTDESLDLTEAGDGTPGAPYGAPRWTGESMKDLEEWLLSIADEYDAAGDIPSWKTEESEPQESSIESTVCPNHSAGHEPSPNVLVKLVSSSQFIGVKTSCRKYGSHGRFLISKDTLQQLMEAPVGSTRYESDCGDYVHITRLNDSLQFSFAWLNTNKDGSITGIRQDIVIPFFQIQLVLDYSEEQKYLYIPPEPAAAVDARPAAAAIHEIAQDKRLRRAFTKAMRDCFRWPGEHVTLYRDGKSSFYFTTASGFPKCGGLILHEGECEGYPYVYYSVHT